MIYFLFSFIFFNLLLLLLLLFSLFFKKIYFFLWDLIGDNFFFTSGQHLRIQDVRGYDRGAYHCRAENRLGVAEVSAHLHVEELPTPVAITTPPHDSAAPRGSTIQARSQSYDFLINSYNASVVVG
jgi:hypothetical protein